MYSAKPQLCTFPLLNLNSICCRFFVIDANGKKTFNEDLKPKNIGHTGALPGRWICPYPH